jgi:hypothetical protein
MDVLKVWGMNDELNVFTIPIMIENPENNKSTIKLCIFDTGFSGYLGLDLDTINNLELDEMGSGNGFSVTGHFEFTYFKAKCQFGDEIEPNQGYFQNKESDSEQNIPNNEIPVQQFELPIIGMGVISQFRWLLIPDQRTILLVK